MICRIWRGWTTPENADVYESIVRGEVIPGIEAMRIPGFEHIDLLRRGQDTEVEFITMMWFDDLESIKAFTGDDYAVSHVPHPRERSLHGSINARLTTRWSIDVRSRADADNSGQSSQPVLTSAEQMSKPSAPDARSRP